MPRFVSRFSPSPRNTFAKKNTTVRQTFLILIAVCLVLSSLRAASSRRSSGGGGVAELLFQSIASSPERQTQEVVEQQAQTVQQLEEPQQPTQPRQPSQHEPEQPEEQQQQQFYDKSKILKLSDTLATAPQTIVTAYFEVRSKYPADNYKNWMQNILSLQDPMVIFLSPSLIPDIQELRKHALDRTVIIPMEVADVPFAHQYNTSFWERQLDIDPEKRRHRSYHVFWIWLSKSWWVTEAVRHNFFNSQVFVWSDMGCFRSTAYNKKQMVQHVDRIPRQSMLFLAHHPVNNLPPERIWNNKYTPQTKPHFYHSGSMMAGYGDIWIQYHAHFVEMVEEFLKRDMFIGEDQTVAQSTCMMHPDLCAYVLPEHLRGRDNHYFGLRYVLHYGGDFTLWHPPPLEQ